MASENKDKWTGILAVLCGGILIVSLFLPWWGPPGVFDDPLAEVPDDVEFMVQIYQMPGSAEISENGFRFYEFDDIVWLITGLVGLICGLAALNASRLTSLLAAATAILAGLSAILIVLDLMSPPDLLEEVNTRLSDRRQIDFETDLSLSREVGGFFGLASVLGLLFTSAWISRRIRGTRS